MAYDESHHQFSFMSAEELNRPRPISIGLSGGSGSGKTYSALMLARGIAEEMGGKGTPIAFVDTENRRGLHYSDTFPEILGHYVDLSPEDRSGKMVGYPPERMSDLLNFVARSDAAALVLDSWTHTWEGINGVIELQAEILAGMGDGDTNNIRAWGKIKPRYRKLINRVIQFPKPVILCTRAKPVLMKRRKADGGRGWIEEPIGKVKTRRPDIPWDIAADGELLFEMTAMAILDPQHPGIPKYQIKVADHFKRLLPADQPITEEAGREMARWSKRQTSATEDKALMDTARAKAREGRDAMRTWWRTLNPGQVGVLTVIEKELQDSVTEAEQRVSREDPFAEPAGPTDQDIDPDRLAEMARAATSRAARTYEGDDDFPGDRVRY